ncbi:MAG: glycosyltransferase family 2 protein [Bdellovibrionales bacterium]
MRKLTVIIPITPEETQWRILFKDLSVLPKETNIIFVGPQKPTDFDTMCDKKQNTKWVQSAIGRGHQMNAGARSSKSDYLWFLHADSRVSQKAIDSLQNILSDDPEELIYFNLLFQNDGPVLMNLNSLGVWIRSHILGLPFGDQGFCISTKCFNLVGGFCEKAPYGEDHLFVWKVRHSNLKLRCTGATISTSSRKYRDNGWGKTTLLHGYLTLKQAMPEMLKYITTREEK